MKLRAKCIPCLLNRVYFETELSTDDEQKRFKAVGEAAAVLVDELRAQSGDGRRIATNVLSTKVHRKAYEVLDDADPYRELKRRSTDTALKMAPEAERIISAAPDRLRAAILCSIVGNIMDFGVMGLEISTDYLVGNFVRLYNEGLRVDDVDKIVALLRPGGSVLFFADNCGEIVFDRLLCRELKKYGVRVSLVVKGGAILTDATREDAEKLFFDKPVNEPAGGSVDEILTTGSNAVGILMSEIPEALEERLASADLIIAKGMANYEALSETDYKPIAYLLRAKCDSVADDLNVPKDANVTKLCR